MSYIDVNFASLRAGLLDLAVRSLPASAPTEEIVARAKAFDAFAFQPPAREPSKLPEVPMALSGDIKAVTLGHSEPLTPDADGEQAAERTTESI